MISKMRLNVVLFWAIKTSLGETKDWQKSKARLRTSFLLIPVIIDVKSKCTGTGGPEYDTTKLSKNHIKASRFLHPIKVVIKLV